VVCGAKLIVLIGISVWYAPGAASAALVETIAKNEKKYLPVV